MNHELEPYEERRPVLPELIDYLRADQRAADLESGRPIININYYEAPRPAPVEPKQDVATKYAGHLVLATWSAIVFTGIAITFMMIAGALMTIMISTAVCALAVAASIRSLRLSRIEARMVDKASRSPRRK